jgi:SAM-dependent methyltransferase
LENVFSQICVILAQNKVLPFRIPNRANPEKPQELDLVRSITASINIFFTLKDFQDGIKIRSVTEYYWHLLETDYIFPFVDEQHDLETMIQIGLPFFDETTLYHEVGVGSGEGIIDVIYRGYHADRLPGSIVGTDINRNSLEAIKLLVEEEFGGLDNVYLRFGNATDSIDDIQFGFTPKVVVMGANRFFSILDPTVLHPILSSFRQQIGQQGFLIAGITTNSARNLRNIQSLQKRYPDKYSLEDSEYGTILYQKHLFLDYMLREGIDEKKLIDDIQQTTGLEKDKIDISRVIRQVYYDPAAFIKAVEKHSFEKKELRDVLQPMHDERMVVLFKNV